MRTPRYFATSRSPFQSRRSPLSPQAAWPTQEPSTTSRYTDAEQLALRAWSSAKLRTAPLVEQVETLLHHPDLEPVYPRKGRRALESRCPVALAEAAESLWAVVLRKHVARLACRRRIPHLFNLLHA